MIPPRKIQMNRRVIPGQERMRALGRFSVKSIQNRLRAAWALAGYLLFPLQARRCLAQLECVAGDPARSRAKGCALVAVHYGNHPALPHFLGHHRRLGIRDFFLLDLSPDGDLAMAVVGDPACVVFRPRNMQPADEVAAWLNALRHRYATGLWCLSLETSDLFVFYRSETRTIADLTEFLESESRSHAFAIVVELYPDRPSHRRAAAPDRDALVQDCCYFDSSGFVTRRTSHRSVAVRGGPQRRTLYKSRPGFAPTLSRTPLVRWRWYFRYTTGERFVMPEHLNIPHAHWHSSPTACILRYALLYDDAVLDNASRWEAPGVVSQEEAPYYGSLVQLADVPLLREHSRRYAGTGDLVDCGLLNPGQWF